VVLHPNRTGKKWQARIGLNQRRISLGYYETKEEASRAYDLAANDLFKEFAATNRELCAQ
jgi:hypothetical protein